MTVPRSAAKVYMCVLFFFPTSSVWGSLNQAYRYTPSLIVVRKTKHVKPRTTQTPKDVDGESAAKREGKYSANTAVQGNIRNVINEE